MVHALQRACRWLVPHGYIIDIHPTSAAARLAIRTPRGVVTAGELEDLTDGCGPCGRHARADAAVRQALAQGWLVLDGRREVTFVHEADTLTDMLEHVAAEWRHARFAPATFERAAALVRAHRHARVLLEEEITLSRLRPAIQLLRRGHTTP
jgi:hypothetical protein